MAPAPSPDVSPEPSIPATAALPLDGLSKTLTPKHDSRTVAQPAAETDVVTAPATKVELPPVDQSAGERPRRERAQPPLNVPRVDRPDIPAPPPRNAEQSADRHPASITTWSPAPFAAASAGQPDSRWTAPITNAYRLVERILDAVSQVQNSGRELVLELSPPEYGPVRIEVRETAGLLTARLEAHTPNAERVLTEHLPQLHDALASRGSNLDRIDVVRFDSGERGGQEFSHPHGSAAGQEQHSEPRPPARRRISAAQTEPPAAAVIGLGNSPLGLQELNVRV
jgi:flagellar hook-length control protein FliK